MNLLRVLIADDSVVYRSQVREALGSIAGVEVVGAASNGRLAIERLRQSSVDLLVLDLEMPEMDGLQTLAAIAEQKLNCKVLVFSSASKRGAEITLEALRLGASDFIAKPGPGEGDQNIQPAQRIRTLIEPKIMGLFPILKTDGSQKEKAATGQYPKIIWELFKPKVIVIGSSTGGPTALEKIFSEIKPPLHCPILIAQHMPPLFTATLAERLQKISGISCREGQQGMSIEPNCMYVAPGGHHMTIAGSLEKPVIALDQGPLVNSVRPAVDPLFASAVQIYGSKCLGIVLTGMGADGQVGAEKIKNAGGAVLIQSEKTCIVFGMPGAVHAVGAFDRILDLSEMSLSIQEKSSNHLDFFTNNQITPRG